MADIRKSTGVSFPPIMAAECIKSVLTFFIRLDPKGVFCLGLLPIRSKLENRSYTSVSTFSRDLANVFTSEIGVESVGDTAELQLQMQNSGRAPELTLEQREKRKLAKRIIKAIQPALEDALKKESELSGNPYEKELRDLDLMLENSVLFRRGSAHDSVEGTKSSETGLGVTIANSVEHQPATAEPPDGEVQDVEMINGVCDTVVEAESLTVNSAVDGLPGKDGDEAIGNTETANGSRLHDQDPHAMFTPPTINSAVSVDMDATSSNHLKVASEGGEPQCVEAPAAPLTPPASFKDSHQPPLAQGGIQWYMEPFDPVGTTIHEERWTGREVLRGMSEELSELDEDELRDLVSDEFDNGVPQQTADAGELKDAELPSLESPAPKTRAAKAKKRWRGFR